MFRNNLIVPNSQGSNSSHQQNNVVVFTPTSETNRSIERILESSATQTYQSCGNSNSDNGAREGLNVNVTPSANLCELENINGIQPMDKDQHIKSEAQKKISLWTFGTTAHPDAVFYYLVLFFAIDCLSAIIDSILLSTFCRINCLEYYLEISRKKWIVMAIQEAHWLNKVNLIYSIACILKYIIRCREIIWFNELYIFIA